MSVAFSAKWVSEPELYTIIVQEKIQFANGFNLLQIISKRIWIHNSIRWNFENGIHEISSSDSFFKKLILSTAFVFVFDQSLYFDINEI